MRGLFLFFGLLIEANCFARTVYDFDQNRINTILSRFKNVNEPISSNSELNDDFRNKQIARAVELLESEIFQSRIKKSDINNMIQNMNEKVNQSTKDGIVNEIEKILSETLLLVSNREKQQNPVGAAGNCSTKSCQKDLICTGVIGNEVCSMLKFKNQECNINIDLCEAGTFCGIRTIPGINLVSIVKGEPNCAGKKNSTNSKCKNNQKKLTTTCIPSGQNNVLQRGSGVKLNSGETCRDGFYRLDDYCFPHLGN